MARMARVIAEGVAHHVTLRGNARRVVFDSDTDRLVYLQLLRQYAILDHETRDRHLKSRFPKLPKTRVEFSSVPISRDCRPWQTSVAKSTERIGVGLPAMAPFQVTHDRQRNHHARKHQP
jgi:hypothetical protein